MESDPVVAEVQLIREQLASRFEYRVDEIVKDAQLQNAVQDGAVVRLPPRRPAASNEVPGQPEPGVGADSR